MKENEISEKIKKRNRDFNAECAEVAEIRNAEIRTFRGFREGELK